MPAISWQCVVIALAQNRSGLAAAPPHAATRNIARTWGPKSVPTAGSARTGAASAAVNTGAVTRHESRIGDLKLALVTRDLSAELTQRGREAGVRGRDVVGVVDLGRPVGDQGG